MSRSDHNELKRLRTRQASLRKELEEKGREVKGSQRELSELEGQLREASEKIKRLTKVVVVSEHAILRYLERKFDIDLDSVKSEILSEETLAQVKHCGSGRYPIGDGLRAVVKDNVVVTVEGG